MSLPAYLVTINAGFQFMVLNSLIAPLPFKVRKSYLRFLMTSKFVARTVYFLKIMAIFIFLLMIDAVRTAYVITLKPDSEGFNSGLDGGEMNATAAQGLNTRKLLAERNMTLTACSLFTSYLLWRVYELNMENVRYGEQVAASKGEDTGPPIDDHRQHFKGNYDSTKPDHNADIRKRNINNREVPVPDHQDVKDTQ